ncbi:hypothetical protein BC830DRAFT_1091783 [Chytriomyces sp. MP71]|nr:hypothetical protein BC830DRAFT_1091783 [Chytriomyces sp. MP71]
MHSTRTCKHFHPFVCFFTQFFDRKSRKRGQILFFSFLLSSAECQILYFQGLLLKKTLTSSGNDVCIFLIASA